MIGYSLRGQRTSAGVGVGTTCSDVRSKYPRVRCTPLLEAMANTDECVLRSPKGRQTVFKVNKFSFTVQAVIIRDRV